MSRSEQNENSVSPSAVEQQSREGVSRRKFMIGAGALAFSGLASSVLGKQISLSDMPLSKGFGPLIADSEKLLDLPAGFSYSVISSLGNVMSDGFHVPDRADGMGCLPLTEDTVALIRNHELKPKHLKTSPKSIQQHKTANTYGQNAEGIALPGGTSTIIYNVKNKRVEKEFLSLVGTIRNCAGGITPWGTWLSCEESVTKVGSESNKDHGYIFEVPATATGVIEAKPLFAMGRFNHEAAAVDPKTGIVYLTEDRGDSLFYRFIPNVYGELDKGGQLQALKLKGMAKFDSRNWDKKRISLGDWHQAEWIDLDQPESPNDDLRNRGYEAGATLFARGEGIHWGEGELYFCCTNGGEKQLGQIMRFQPDSNDVAGGRLQLFLESEDETLYNFGDNLTVTPFGHLIVCEDQYTDVVDNHLRGVTPDGKLYNFAKLRAQTELAGACFSPDGKTLFVNVYSPTKTLAITGPWDSFLG